MTAVDTQDTPVAPKRKRRRIIVSTIAATILLAAGIAVPLTIQAADHREALAAYEQQSLAFDAARNDVLSEQGTANAAQDVAALEREKGIALRDVAAGTADAFTPGTAIDDLTTALDALTATANITEQGDGSLTKTRIEVPDVTAEGAGLTDGNTTDELRTGAASLADATDELTGEVTTLKDRTSEIQDAITDVQNRSLDLIAAGYASGTAWTRPEKSSDESWAAYTAAVDAMRGDNLVSAVQSLADDKPASDLTALAKSYVEARAAAQKSQDDTVAAEQAAAAAKASQEAADAAARARQSSSGASGSGGSSGSGTGGAGTSGGGVSSGRVGPTNGGNIGNCNDPGVNCGL